MNTIQLTDEELRIVAFCVSNSDLDVEECFVDFSPYHSALCKLMLAHQQRSDEHGKKFLEHLFDEPEPVQLSLPLNLNSALDS